MSSQNRQDSQNPSTRSQRNQSAHSADGQHKEQQRMGSLPQIEKMETFPKTNTFPKHWDLSSFSKE